MISTFLKPILLIVIFSFSSLLLANQFDNPYQGNVIATSASESELKEQALLQVLIKVSGNSGIGSLSETKSLLNKAQQFVSQYGYQTEQGEKYFSAVFDQNKINQSLRDMQQPVWGDTRPTTLIWLINNNQLVSEQDINSAGDTSLSLPLKQAQQARGIQVQFPLMDLDDNIALSVSDVRGRFYDQVANATMRYARGHFVVAEFKAMAGDKWKLSWRLVQTDTVSKQHAILKNEQFIDTKAQVITQMVDTLADFYAGQYAILENQNEKFMQTVHINGIDSLQKLAKLNNVFENLLAISSFSIVSAKADQVSVDVKLKGALQALKTP
ncbi:DUF2066 domain-containing protein [Psychromonas sp. KJ10-10]|uniref:DUF2066 domain-containing protein n=1 Tax=Psychromonas sp. KJ10-10 TaxID=3391823 RepID=UPI0039B650AE